MNIRDEAILEQDAKVATEKIALRTHEGYYVRAVNGNGKRTLNVAQIKALSKRFNVSPAVFI